MPDTSIERRLTPRRTTACEAELVANLSLLDSESNATESLVFMGQALNLSALGIGFILPSLQIDERYCAGDNRLKLSLHLPRGSVTLEVSAVRCQPLDINDKGQGYLMGAKIISVLENELEFAKYLDHLKDGEPKGE